MADQLLDCLREIPDTKNMKLFLICIGLWLISVNSSAGTLYHWTGASSGSIVVDGTGTSGNHALSHGDSLDFPGGFVWLDIVFQNIQGILNDSIVIVNPRVGNSTCTFCTGDLLNLNYVKFINYTSHNNASTVIFAKAINATAGTGVYNCTFDHCKFWNDPGSFSSQCMVIFEDQFNASSPMYFTGNINQTYHDITFQYCDFEGLINTDGFRRGTDTTRSICLHFNIQYDTCKYMINTTGIAPEWFTANNCYGGKIHDNVFVNFMYPTPYCGSCSYTGHTTWIALFGNDSIYNNRVDSGYVNSFRVEGMQFNGLPGFMGPCKVYNNIDTRHYHYSMMEWSRNNMIAGNWINRMDGYADSNSCQVYNNTLYFTNRDVVNGVYSGMLVDKYADSLTVYHNAVIAPEVDFTFDLATRGYIIFDGNGIGGPLDTADNQVIATWALANLQDSISFRPLKTSSLYRSASNHAPTVLTDFFNKPKPLPANKGAVNTIDPTLWIFPRRAIFKSN